MYKINIMLPGGITSMLYFIRSIAGVELTVNKLVNRLSCVSKMYQICSNLLAIKIYEINKLINLLMILYVPLTCAGQ